MSKPITSLEVSQEPHLLAAQLHDGFFKPFEGNKWYQDALQAGLDPFVGAIAASPQTLEKQSYASLLSILGRQVADAYRGRTVSGPERKIIDDVQDGLRSGANDVLYQRSGRAEAIAASVGIVAGAYGYDRLLLDPVDTSSGLSSKLVDDPSILPGKMGTLEVFGHTIGIPGFKDLPRTKREFVSYNVTTKQAEIDTVDATVAYERGQNDPALDLELTGREYAQDKEVAEGVIDEIISIGEDHELKSVTVFGVSSDELFNEAGVDNLGTYDKENKVLAEQRAAVGAVAFEDAAKAKGLKTPEIELASYEIVLSQGDISTIDMMADKLGLSRIELIKSFNRNTGDIPEDTIQELEKLLPRGVSYSIEYERTTTKIDTIQEVKEVKNESITSGLPSEALAFPTMAALAGVSTLLLAKRIQYYMNKRAARKEIKQALRTV